MAVAHVAVTMFRHKRATLSSTPNNVLNTVESTNSMSPARFWAGGNQRKALNSWFPAWVKGCGLEKDVALKHRWVGGPKPGQRQSQP
jgi:hypothetical protein